MLELVLSIFCNCLALIVALLSTIAPWNSEYCTSTHLEIVHSFLKNEHNFFAGENVQNMDNI